MAKPKISSNLGHSRSVAKGVKVTYQLEDYEKTSFVGGGGGYRSGEEGSLYDWQWWVTYHHLDDDGKDPEVWKKDKDDAGNSTHNLFFTKKWDKVGRHLVRCQAKNRHTKEFVGLDDGGYLEFPQQVEELEAILERQMEHAKKEKLPNPNAELTMLWKWLILLDLLGKLQAPYMSPATQKAHGKRIAELENYAEKLKALLNRCSDTVWPFRGVYLAKESMEDKDLRVFLTQPRGKTDRVMIVDWTNLDEPRLHGEYEGKISPWEGLTTSALIYKAFQEAVGTWESNNRYWPGGIRYELTRTFIGGSAIGASGTIMTGGTDFEEDLAAFLKKIAMGAAVLALVLTGVGSTLAGAMIVTSMVAGTTGSVLSIHHRHAKEEGGFMDDAMDVLDIVANVLGVGYRAGKAVVWQAGRTVEIKLADKVLKAMFIGEVWADGFNGLLLGVDFVKRYDQIMEAKGMLPEERANALLGLFKEAATVGALHGLNNKVATMAEEANWKRLLERSDGVPVHIDEPSFKSHTNEGEKKVTVVNKQQRHPPAGVQSPAPITPRNVKKLGLGLKSRRRGYDYIQWSEEKGFLTYGKLSGRGTFSEQIEQALTAADEIHFNLDGVDVKRASGTLNEFGEPPNGNYTNYELWLLKTKKTEYGSKARWWLNGEMKPAGWWPEGL
jgi:hypothetical protein